MSIAPRVTAALAVAPSTLLPEIDGADLEQQLDRVGWCRVPRLLGAEQCAELAALYDDETRFRSTVVMARHNFGSGQYRYFAHPLPEPVERLRTALYAQLVPVARRWHGALGLPESFPDTHAEYLEQCHLAGQTRPTPLLLDYRPGDYNCLHQDLYGELVFPLQVACLLSEPGRDFEGGELVLTEQRPRMQSRATVVPLAQGDAVAFAVRDRPVTGTRGVYRVKMRHGVSSVRSGQRRVLGLIFHDAT